MRSRTVKPLKTLCFNLRYLTKHFDLWTYVSKQEDCNWPADYEIPDLAAGTYEFITDTQKTFSKLIGKRSFTFGEVKFKFVAVGVRWLGFFCSLLHASLTMNVLLPCLKKIPATDIPNKTVTGILNNTITCLEKLKEKVEVRKSIFMFCSVYFPAWRSVITSDGSTLFDVCIQTTKDLAVIGETIKLGPKYIETLNRHLYNIDGVFLPLSFSPTASRKVGELINEFIEDGNVYEPALFKDRPTPKFSLAALKTLSLDMLLSQPKFRERVATSPIFKHLGDDLGTIQKIYATGNVSYWEKISKLVPGHNQRCEQLVGDLKRSTNIDALVTINHNRQCRKRSMGHVLKGV